jgi:hypothetical protein
LLFDGVLYLIVRLKRVDLPGFVVRHCDSNRLIDAVACATEVAQNHDVRRTCEVPGSSAAARDEMAAD